MDDRKKTKRKLYNIFEKDKTCNSLNEIPNSDLETPKFNLKLTARRRSTRLKSEIFVERIPPDSPENDPYAFTKNDCEDTKLVYTPPKKKAKISKSPSFMERIDRYFNIQPSKASNTLSANSCRTILDATEEAEQKIDKTVHFKALDSPKLKEDVDLQEYADSFIDSIDTNAIVEMLNNTEIIESQSQVKDENSKNIATPEKCGRKSNANQTPIVRLNSNERKVSSKENNNLQKRKAKSKTSKKNQNIIESAEIIEEKSQVQNKISKSNTTSKECYKKPKENIKAVISLKTTERKGLSKENKSMQPTKTKSETTKANSSQQLSASLTSSPQKTIENEKSVSLGKRVRRPTISGIQRDNNVAGLTKNNDSCQLPSTSLTLNPQKKEENERSVSLRKRGRRQTICGVQMDNNFAEVTETVTASVISSPQKYVENERSVSLRKRERRPTISSEQMDNNAAEVTETNESNQFPAASLISSAQKSVENERSLSLRKRGRRPTISNKQMDNNFAEITENDDTSQLPAASPALSSQKTVKNEIPAPIRKRGRRQTICGTQMDNNVAEVTKNNDSCQLPSASMTSSPQKTLENERSVSLRKRGRRPTISGIQMDNNAAEITETNDSSQLPSASLALSSQKTVKNEISVPIRKRGRRQTICGTQMDNNVAEVTENNDSSQLPSASMTSSPQKTVENERSVFLRKRGRRPTVSGIQMDNNAAEITETNDSSQLPSASLALSSQKTVKNEISVPIRKRGRRQTICGTQMDNNVAEVKKNNDSSQLTSVSPTSSPQKFLETEISVPIRKRGRRPTISGIQMDNNIAEVTETNDNSQLPRKRGRRPTICQTKLDNYFTREANKTNEANLENQTEINSDENVTKRITKDLNECITKRNANMDTMTNNSSNEQSIHRLPDIHNEITPTGSQQVKNQSIKPPKIRSTNPNDNKVVEEHKRKRGRPRLSPNVAAEKQAKMRIQKINVAKKRKNTYGRISKDNLNSGNVRRIPKDRLDEALDMLQNEDHEIWKDRNISCNAGIHRYWETRTMTSDQNMKMKYARQFLLRRDWLNLSKILCLSNQDAKNNIYYPLLVKYATLCLAHTDKEQFHKFVNSLITMADSSAIIKKCTKISRENEE